MRRVTLAAVVLVAAGLVPALAHGETIFVTITAGTAEATRERRFIEASGPDGFTLSTNLSSQGSICLVACLRQPGEILSGHGLWGGLDLFDPVVTLNGVTYTDIAGFNDRDSLTVEFSSPPLTMPDFAAGPLSLETPFSFSATFRHSGGEDGDEGFVAEITGLGTATIDLIGRDVVPGGVYEVQGYRWEFAAVSQEPIPEPGTIALIGAGLAGVCGIARRRRRRQA